MRLETLAPLFGSPIEKRQYFTGEWPRELQTHGILISEPGPVVEGGAPRGGFARPAAGAMLFGWRCCAPTCARIQSLSPTPGGGRLHRETPWYIIYPGGLRPSRRVRVWSKEEGRPLGVLARVTDEVDLRKRQRSDHEPSRAQLAQRDFRRSIGACQAGYARAEPLSQTCCIEPSAAHRSAPVRRTSYHPPSWLDLASRSTLGFSSALRLASLRAGNRRKGC
jgi:hypothetical protein